MGYLIIKRLRLAKITNPDSTQFAFEDMIGWTVFMSPLLFPCSLSTEIPSRELQVSASALASSRRIHQAARETNTDLTFCAAPLTTLIWFLLKHDYLIWYLTLFFSMPRHCPTGFRSGCFILLSYWTEGCSILAHLRSLLSVWHRHYGLRTWRLRDTQTAVYFFFFLWGGGVAVILSV